MRYKNISTFVFLAFSLCGQNSLPAEYTIYVWTLKNADSSYDLQAFKFKSKIDERLGPCKGYVVKLFKKKKLLASRAFGYNENEILGSSVAGTNDKGQMVREAKFLMRTKEMPDVVRLYEGQSLLKSAKVLEQRPANN